ncbi:signal peptidase I [Streptomyces sp. NPDC047971]|uniref:signal peptidase I n=1 Tax=Streptomyces sp. NPDC047971 TaxID=3154499 RepID=UPI0033C94A3F
MRPGRGLRITGWVLLPVGILLLVGAVLTGVYGYSAHKVASDSMSPTYTRGDTAYTEMVDAADVRRGDVVLYNLPERYPEVGAPIMQRVIGVGGDRVNSDGRRVFLNGEPLVESYLSGGDPVGDTTQVYDVKVPEGRLFLLGDNRGNSLDSRYFRDEGNGGTVPADAVLERTHDNEAVIYVIGLGAFLGIGAALTGFGCGLAGWLVGRRPKPVPAPSPRVPSPQG